MSFEIEVQGGSSVRLPTAGKYCDRDIVVTAAGGDTEGAYDEGYEAGQQTEYDRFWDAYQNNGKRTVYVNAFVREGWNDETFKPKYDIKIVGNSALTGIFEHSRIESFKEILEAQGVWYDMSGFTSSSGAGEISGFYLSSIKHFGRAIFPTTPINIGAMFRRCYYLHSVDRFDLHESGLQTFNNNAFQECYDLENITITGKIGQNGFNVSWSTKLTHDSLMSIINALQEKTSGTWTVTLGTTNLAKLTDAERAIATEKGWTLV